MGIVFLIYSTSQKFAVRVATLVGKSDDQDMNGGTEFSQLNCCNTIFNSLSCGSGVLTAIELFLLLSAGIFQFGIFCEAFGFVYLHDLR